MNKENLKEEKQTVSIAQYKMDRDTFIINKLSEIVDKLDIICKTIENKTTNNATYNINIPEFDNLNFGEIMNSLKTYINKI